MPAKKNTGNYLKYLFRHFALWVRLDVHGGIIHHDGRMIYENHCDG
jgi:hypothetical protein